MTGILIRKENKQTETRAEHHVMTDGESGATAL